MQQRCPLSIRAAAASVALALLFGGTARAEDVPGDVAAGRTLVEKTCSECHSVSPAQRRQRLYKGPGFDELAANPRTTAISLRAFLQQSHPTMPNFMLTEKERDNVIAFILSLKQHSH